MKRNQKRKQYAFWEYTHFPYVLGAEILAKHKAGTIEAKGYGPGYYFRPIYICGEEEGKRLREQLETLKNSRDIVLNAVEEGFNSKLKALLPTKISKVLEPTLKSRDDA